MSTTAALIGELAVCALLTVRQHLFAVLRVPLCHRHEEPDNLIPPVVLILHSVGQPLTINKVVPQRR